MTTGKLLRAALINTSEVILPVERSSLSLVSISLRKQCPAILSTALWRPRSSRITRVRSASASEAACTPRVML